MFARKARYSLAVAALSVLRFGYGVPSASANAILIDTGAPASIPVNGEDWQVTRLPPAGNNFPGNVVNVSPASLPGSWVTAATVNATQNAIVGDPMGHAAQWVSTDSTGDTVNTDVNGQEYSYTDSFSLGNFTGPALIDLSGTISSDNWIPGPTSPTIPGGLTDPTGITLTYGGVNFDVPITVLTPVSPPALGQETMYQYAFNITTSGSFTSPTNFALKVNVVNSYENPTNGLNPGPTGLILAGTAFAIPLVGSAAVPLPSAGGSVLVLLGGVAGFSAIRRRVMA